MLPFLFLTMIEFIKKMLPTLPYDKKLHFGCSFIIAALAGLAGNVLGMTWLQAFYTGFGISIAAGFGKEYGDKINPANKWDWSDVLADAIGAGLGAGLACWI